jgi:hypothetical protein
MFNPLTRAGRVILEEAEENKVTQKESNFDNLVNTTFKLGLSEREKNQRKKVALPHFEKIDRGDDDDGDGMTQLVDDE